VTQAADPVLRVHAFERHSRANGPGVRAVVWVQGCTLGCPGCFNPDTHDAGGGGDIPVSELVDRVLAEAAVVEGITVSGGEPFEQPAALAALLSGGRAAGLSVLVFSGFTVEEIRARPGGDDLLALIDVLIDGRYLAGQRHGRGLRGSANQRIHLLGERYTRAEVERTPEAEVRIGADGSVVISGVAPLRLR